MDPTSSRRTDLHLWLRHRPGACQSGEHFAPLGADAGTGVQASYGYLGDMQVRFIFEAPVAAPALASERDLEQLQLTPDGALLQAMVNLRRTYGAPRTVLLECGVYGLQCEAQELASSYLLDRVFWNGQLEKFPQGLIAAVPRPETLVFVPADDPQREADLAEHAARIAERAGDKRISGYLYRFGAQGWQLHRPLPAAAPVAVHAAAPLPPAVAAPRALVAAPATPIDLGEVAAGQRLMIRSIAGTLLANAAIGALSAKLLLFVYVVLAICGFTGVWRLASGLGKSLWATLCCLVLSCIPLANLLTCIVLSSQANRVLRAAGWKVGLLGAREPA